MAESDNNTPCDNPALPLDRAYAKDVANAAESYGSYIPGLPGQVVSAVGAAASGGISSEEELQNLERAGIRLRSSSSAAAKRKLRALENRPFERFKHVAIVGAASLFGGFVGATLLTALLPQVPLINLIAGLIGSVITGYVAEHIYSGTCTPHEQDGMKLVADSYVRQRQRQRMNEHDAACIMLANLSEKEQKPIEELFEKKLGTRDIAEIARRMEEGDGKCADCLTTVMRDPVVEDKLRAAYNLPVDITTSVYKQYASLVNNGLDARAIVLDPQRIPDAARAIERMKLEHMLNTPQGMAMPQQPFPQQFPVQARAAKPARSA